MRVYEITLSREAQSLSMSRGPVPNSNQCIRVGTACDKGVWPFEAATRDGRSAQIRDIPRGKADGSNRPRLCKKSWKKSERSRNRKFFAIFLLLIDLKPRKQTKTTSV